MENDSLIFDINSIMNFIFDKEGDEITNKSEITEVYGFDDNKQALSLMNKQINEIKGEKNDSNTAIRYDFIKNLMNVLFDIESVENTTLIESMIFNTFISQGFIKNLK